MSVPWSYILLLLFFPGFPLLPAGNFLSFVRQGRLSVEPGPPFLLGSNLTVYCHLHQCDRGTKVSLQLRQRNKTLFAQPSCPGATAVFSVALVRTPKLTLVCKMKTDQKPNWTVVDGRTLSGGLPPDKPRNITCDTTNTSSVLRCAWQRGWETHLMKSYNTSLRIKENGTEVNHVLVRDAETIEIPRTLIDGNTEYELTVTALNQLGVSQSEPFSFIVKDIVIPETPDIAHVEFVNNSLKATLHWECPECDGGLRPQVRFRSDKGFWEESDEAELWETPIRVGDLKPLTDYEFQVRVCHSPCRTAHTSSTVSGFASRCSRWSSSVTRTTPEKGPSQQLQVWRVMGSRSTDGVRNITVLWKPLPPEEYSGEVLHYAVWTNGSRLKTCAANSTRCYVQVLSSIRDLSISAVTSYGTSPPAEVEIRHTGASGLLLQEVTPAPDGSSIYVSWSSDPDKELLFYVIEWTSLLCVACAEPRWKKLERNLTNTSVTGLTAGVCYNLSLYAVTSGGVSSPTSVLIYSKEEKPTSGPTPRVLAREGAQVLIQWDELNVDQQRGFITNYTLYLQKLDSSWTERSSEYWTRVTISGLGSRNMWVDCPAGTLALQMTATNSAGEGPRGTRVGIPSQPDSHAAGVVIVVVFVLGASLAVMANLMCFSCLRTRMKQKFVSCGPAWLVGNVPKPGHSTAIRLLKEDDSRERLFSSAHSDPPLSPITVISQEEEDTYPAIVGRASPNGSQHCTAETPDTPPVHDDHAGYKPQIPTLDPDVEEDTDVEDVQGSPSGCTEENDFSGACDGFLEDLLSRVKVEYTDTCQGLTLGSHQELLWSDTVETNTLSSIFSQEKRRAAEHNNVVAALAGAQQHDVDTPGTADTCQCSCTTGAGQSGGYFPQVTSVCDTPAH